MISSPLMDDRRGRLFDFFVAISQFWGVCLVVLSGYYHGGFGPGLQWKEQGRGNFGNMNYHGVLMTYGFVFLQGEALLAFRLFRHETKIFSKVLHFHSHARIGCHRNGHRGYCQQQEYRCTEAYVHFPFMDRCWFGCLLWFTIHHGLCQLCLSTHFEHDPCCFHALSSSIRGGDFRCFCCSSDEWRDGILSNQGSQSTLLRNSVVSPKRRHHSQHDHGRSRLLHRLCSLSGIA